MAIGSGVTNSGEGVFSPTNYLLEEVKILRQNLGSEEIGQKAIEIKKLVPEITIKESIYRNAINVDIRVVDNVKLLNFLRLNGTEKVILKISRKQNDDLNKFNLNLNIANIDMFTQINPSTQSYVLRCVPEYVVLNQGQTISQKFSDMSKDISAICGSIGIKEDAQDIPVTGISSKGIIPFMKPLSAIGWLVRNSHESGTPFYFYQTSNGIVHLKSYINMIEDVHEDGTRYNDQNIFNYYQENPGEKDSADDFFTLEKFQIRKLNSKLNLSGLRNISNGAYASNKFSVDIFEKNYKSDESFSYDVIDKKLNEHKPFPEDLKIKDVPLNKYSTGKNYYINLNGGAFSKAEDISEKTDNQNYHGVINDQIQQKEAYHHLLDTHQQELVLAGDFNMQVGKPISNVSIINL